MRICLPLTARRIRRCASAAVVVLAALAVTASMADQVSASTAVPAGRVITSAALSGVSCPRSSWCMAVGKYTDRHHASHSLAEVWNGQRWRVMADPPGPGLVSVSCSAPWFCMVFGSQPTAPTGTMTWNGRTWRKVARPHDAVGGPSCGSKSWCVARRFRNQSVLVWNGKTWQDTLLCAVDQCVFGVSCASASLCAAVGEMQNDAYEEDENAFIWNKQWNLSLQWISNPVLGVLLAVSCTGKICIAVGGNSTAVPGGNASEWNNATQSWQDISPHNGVSIIAPAISCGSSSSCMTFDNYTGGVNTWWNGSTWQKAPVAGTGRGSKLSALSCGGSVCLEVGYRPISGIRQTLAELWNGSGWKIIATPVFHTR